MDATWDPWEAWRTVGLIGLSPSTVHIHLGLQIQTCCCWVSSSLVLGPPDAPSTLLQQNIFTEGLCDLPAPSSHLTYLVPASHAATAWMWTAGHTASSARRIEMIFSSLSPFSSVQRPQRTWEGATPIQGGLETPSKTHPEMCLHGDSKPSEKTMKINRCNHHPQLCARPPSASFRYINWTHLNPHRCPCLAPPVSLRFVPFK